MDVGDKLIKVENEKINDNYKLNKLQSLFKKNTKNTILVSLKNSKGNIYNTTLNKAAAEEMIIYYNETKINSGRIGISYQLKSDTIFVTSVEKNGPSFKAGLKTGDKIVSIDKVKVNTFQNDYAKVSAKLRGEKGTKVSVDVLSKESNKITTIQITREIIKLK
ncbi:MAG: PDZ domain-containing protein [Saprospirales bacterium]|nr:PDZ domain-containing protein [Saprospirales bacterium]